MDFVMQILNVTIYGLGVIFLVLLVLMVVVMVVGKLLSAVMGRDLMSTSPKGTLSVKEE